MTLLQRAKIGKPLGPKRDPARTINLADWGITLAPSPECLEALRQEEIRYAIGLVRMMTKPILFD